MKKIAIIVVGSHFSGKSKTITKYLKPLLGITEKGHKFTLTNCNGFVLSQTREERRDFDNDLSKYFKYDVLVLPTRPNFEEKSLLDDTREKLREKGFVVKTIQITEDENENFYKQRANEIFTMITERCV